MGRSLRELRWVDDRMMAAQGIYLYHYSLLFPKQVQEKCDYYQHADWAQRHEVVFWAQVDRKSVVSGKSVSVRVGRGGSRIMKKTSLAYNKPMTETTMHYRKLF